MKKFLLTATMLVCLSALSQAQQGRVGINTTTPAATLDVVANTTDNTRPDALLVPRLTRAQLAAKDGAYVTAQNGALTFVTTLDGTAAGKTANVTATGFYYYDAPNTVWVAVGGGGGVSRYEGIRGNATIVTNPTYTLQSTDNVIVTRATTGVAITLPSLTNTPADIGRIIKVINNNTTATALTFTNGAGDTPPTILGNLIVNQNRGIEFVWTGTTWSSPQK
ncbi:MULTISPECIES: hypothetical protein [Chryseobacterium]|uniref:Uncharacterized protein n=1 Tax=Chryseobacterium indologenes TaxID=253 RepID=A0A3G5Z024_CHRID|nr:MULTISPECIES: hypothetical protein [Chryseobacterium]ATN06257.1 hypothetical protein CRN76_13020 [Chryseobacterium indologenes]AYY84982.1 hypothetical protein EGX91_10715 [Chryseobacterium indologenes]AZB18137.1 hypothetical protein EG352_10295 [Chryseobacterium indologenes]MBF6643228.1 hypothetical protein [Chryseobacterium indologenes]MEB4758938.1 hypothetical protein [Chryseobacterium indologenes]